MKKAKTHLLQGMPPAKKWIVICCSVLLVCSMAFNCFLLVRLQQENQAEQEKDVAKVEAQDRLAELSSSQDNYLYEDLIPQIGEYITSAGYSSDTWAVAVIDAETGTMASWNSHPMMSASIIKQFIMGAVYDNWDEIIDYYDEDTVNYYLNGMITKSDNDCANNCIRIVGFDDYQAGIDAVNAFCQKYGYTQTKLDHTFYGGTEDDEDNLTSAEDNASFQYDVLTDRFEHSDDMMSLLLQQYWRYKIPGGIPSGVTVANKTGDLDNVENDCAVVWASNGTYVLAVMSQDLVAHVQSQGVIRGISSLVYSYFQDLDRDALNGTSSSSTSNQEEADETQSVEEDQSSEELITE